ncbi:MAG: Ig-like domain-containing protein [Eubacteriaceae bacterium]|nr:Ig-like domain-containing protein [Eubacteriaceae bacterium]
MKKIYIALLAVLACSAFIAMAMPWRSEASLASAIATSPYEGSYRANAVSGAPAEYRANEGESIPISITALPEVPDAKLFFATSDASIAVVKDGSLVAVKRGKCDLIVRRSIDSAIIAVIPVRIGFIAVESVLFPVSAAEISKGESISLNASALPESASNKTLAYVSRNPDIAIVSPSGSATGLKAGTAVIEAISADDSSKRSEMSLTVIQKAEIIEIIQSEYRLHPGGKSLARYIVVPQDTTEKMPLFSVSDPSIASVDASGQISGIKEGTCELIITANGSEARATGTIIVTNKNISSVSISPKAIEIYKGEKSQIKSSVYPADATFPEVAYESSDASVATVSETGLVTAVKAGKAEIKASAQVGSSASDSVLVIVLEHVESVSAPEKISLATGKQQNINAVALPDSATDKTLTYTSSDSRIAFVDSQGNVLAVSPGKAKVTVAASSGAKAEIEIEAIRYVTKVEAEPSLMRIYTKSQTPIKYSVLPADASNKGLSFQSSNPLVATVSEAGMVTAVKAGSATISITADDGAGAAAKVNVTVMQKVESVAIEPKEAKLYTGQSLSLKATALPSDSTNKSIRWTCSNIAVCSVSETGEVVALRPGKAVLTAVATDFSLVTESVSIEVLRGIDSLIPHKAEMQLPVGSSEKLSAIAFPSDASDLSLSYQVSNPQIASINAQGVATMLSAGECTITATANDGFGASCTWRISAYIVAQSITPPPSPFVMYVGEETTPKVVLSPQGASPLIFASSSPEIATVSEAGSVKALKNGSAIISAYSSDGSNLSAEFTVEVRTKLTGLRFLRPELLLYVGETDTITPVLIPSNAYNTGITWSSSDSGVASVNRTGSITVHKAGKAVIRAQSDSEAAIYAEAEVTAMQRAVSISFSSESIKLYTSETASMPAEVLPQSTTNKSVSYRSGNTSVAIVSDQGIVRGLEPGKAEIYASALDGSGAVGSYTVEVIRKPQSIELAKPAHMIYLGESYTIEASVKPDDATGKELAYSSSNESVATVDKSGKITAHSTGEAVITISCLEAASISAPFRLVVLQLSESITTEPLLNIDINGPGIKIDYKVLPESATDKSVTFFSANPAVASVSQDGYISCHKPGKALIAIIACDGGGASAQIVATVFREAESLVALEPSISLYTTSKAKFPLQVLPEGSTGAKIVYSSSSKDVADVSEDGIITAVSAGEAMLTAQLSDKPGSVASLSVKVLDYTSKIVLNISNIEMNAGDEYKPSASIEHLILNEWPKTPGANAIESMASLIEWTSSDPGVAIVENGIIKALKPGEAVLTASMPSARCEPATINAVVAIHPYDVSIDKKEAFLFVGESLSLKAILAPVGAQSGMVEWSSSDERVATVSQDGLVTASMQGEAEITARINEEAFAVSKISVSIPIESIELDAKALSVYIGQPQKLQAKIVPESAAGSELAWSSSNPQAVTVDESGTVTAISPGKATITASSKDKRGASASVAATSSYKLEKIELSPDVFEIKVGQGRQLETVFLPKGAQAQPIEFASSDETIATVTQRGYIRAIGPGEATITAKSGEFEAVCEVNSLQPVVGLKPEATYMLMRVGEESLARVAVQPENASNPKLVFMSTNPAIAKAGEEGEITALSQGKCEIIVKTSDGSNFEGYISVNVIESTSQIDLGPDIVMRSGEQFQLSPSIMPKSALIDSLRYVSSNTEIAVVDYKGLITAVKEGKVTISAVAGDGSDTSAKIAVTVVRVAEIRFAAKQATVHLGTRYSIKHTTYPLSDTESKIIWSSSEPKVASVDAYGNVTASSPGHAVITARAAENPKATASISITVDRLVESIQLSKSNVSMLAGGTDKLVATVAPSNATNRTLSWASSDRAVASVSSSGVITAHAPGEAVVTVSAVDGSGAKGEAKVTVTASAASIKATKKAYRIKAGDSQEIKYSLLPLNATIKTANFASSDESVAIATRDGFIQAVSPGNCEISITTTDGTNLSATASVEVIPVRAASISLSASSVALHIGEGLRLSAQVGPANATNQGYRLSSSNESAFIVTESGAIKAVGAGTALITAVSSDGGYKSSCRAVSFSTATGIELSQSSLSMKIGESRQLELAAFPQSAEIEPTAWASSDENVAAVSNAGIVTALSEGQCEVSAQYGPHIAVCSVSASYIGVMAESIKLPEKIYAVAGTSFDIKAAVSPLFANETLHAVSSDPLVASIAGSLTGFAHKEGTAVITLSGARASASVEVIATSHSSYKPLCAAAPAGCSAVELKWDLLSSAASYEIFRSLSPERAYSKIAECDYDQGSYLDTGLTCGSEYYYMLRAVSSDSGYTSFSNTIMCIPQPNAPEITNISTQDSGLMSIALSIVEGASGYEIESSSSGDVYTLAGRSAKPEYAFALKSNKSPALYRARAFVDIGPKRVYSSYSEPKGARYAPMMPNLAVDAIDYNSTRAVAASPGADGIALYRSGEELGAYSYIGFVNSETAVFENTGLIAGKPYYYKASAFYSSKDGIRHESPLSGSVHAVPMPNIPFGLQADASGLLSWQPVLGANGYELSYMSQQEWKSIDLTGQSAISYSIDLKSKEATAARVRSYTDTPLGRAYSAYCLPKPLAAP